MQPISALAQVWQSSDLVGELKRLDSRLGIACWQSTAGRFASVLDYRMALNRQDPDNRSIVTVQRDDGISGLPALAKAARIMDEFEIKSEVGEGTAVAVCKWLR
jgi:hypothetical protein